MPFAPQAVNIRYGSPTDLAMLAGQAGSAENAMNNYRTQYAGYLQRLGQDQSFLNDEANRRQNDSHFTQQLAVKQNEDQAHQAEVGQANELQDAYHQSLLAIKNKAIDARQAAQRGVTSRPAVAAKPLDLVDANGNPYTSPVTKGTGIIQNTDTGEVTQDIGGQISDYNAEGNVLEGPGGRDRIAALDAQAGPVGPNQPPITRQQYMQNQRLAATRENLDIREQNVNSRQQTAIANRQAPMTIAQRDAAHKVADATALQGVLDSGDPAQIANTVNSELWRPAGGLVIKPDNANSVAKGKQILASHVARLITESKALTQPTVNSNGATPTGGNPVPVTDEASFLALPPGTVVKFPDGRIGRRP